MMIGYICLGLGLLACEAPTEQIFNEQVHYLSYIQSKKALDSAQSVSLSACPIIIQEFPLNVLSNVIKKKCNDL